MFQKVMRKNQKNELRFLVVDPPIVTACTPRVPDIKKKSLIKLCFKVCQPVYKLSNEALLKSLFIQIPDLVHRPTAAAVTNKN